MLKQSIVSFILVSLCMWTNSFAEESLYSVEYEQCLQKSGGVTTYVIECTGQEIDRLDAELNTLYKKIMRELDEEIKAEKAIPDSYLLEEVTQAKKALLNSQRLWLKYRDLEASFVRNMLARGGGSDGRIMGGCRYVEVLATRVKDLKQYWKYVSPQQD